MPSLYSPPTAEQGAATTVTDAAQPLPSTQQQPAAPQPSETAKVSRFKVQAVPGPPATAPVSHSEASLHPPPAAIASQPKTASTSTVSSTGGLSNSLMLHLESELRKVSGVSAPSQIIAAENAAKAHAVAMPKPAAQQHGVAAVAPSAPSNSSKSHTPGLNAEVEHSLAGLTEKLQALSAKQQQVPVGHDSDEAHRHHAAVPHAYATSAALSRAGSMAPPDDIDSASSTANLLTGAHSAHPLQVETLNGLASALQKVLFVTFSQKYQ